MLLWSATSFAVAGPRAGAAAWPAAPAMRPLRTRSTPTPPARLGLRLLRPRAQPEDADPPASTSSLDLSDADGPSLDLQDLVQAHLRLLPALLAGAAATSGRPGGGPAAIRAAAYVRPASSLASGRLRLRRLATLTHPPPPGGDAGTAAEDAPAISLEGLGDQDAVAEDYLARRACVPLPGGKGLVLPLPHGRFLLGLLVVELDAASTSSDSDTGDSDGDGDPAASTDADPAPYEADEADIAVLTAAASVLAAAAALDARAALDAADGAARRAAAASLVEAARGPLAALRTFGAMLLPRTGNGAGGASSSGAAGTGSAAARDMAAGVVAQGDRLAGVVSALAAALHPPPATARRVMAGGRSGGGGGGEALPGGPGGQRAGLLSGGAPRPALPAPPTDAATAAPLALASPTSTPVAAALSDAVSAAAPVADALGIALTLETAPGSAGGAKAGVPEGAVRAIVGDAIDSALQRCARGGRVRVVLSNAGGGGGNGSAAGVVVDISDTGAGTMARTLAAHLARARATAAAAAAAAAASSGPASSASSSTSTAVTAVMPPLPIASPEEPSAAEAVARLSAGLPSGSGAVALAAATRAAAAVGARLVVGPALESEGGVVGEGGTRVRIWLPPAAE